VAVDSSGRVYVADEWNARVQVFDTNGAYLTTIGGSWGPNTGSMRGPSGVAVDSAGNVYVTDRDNHRIQKFAPGVPGWRQSNLNGFGDNANQYVTSLSVFDTQLYAGTYNPGGNGAQLWRMDGSGSWSSVVTNGFGNSFNVGIDDLFVFNGRLYAGTWADETHGGEVWRSADGAGWDPVVESGFGDPTNAEVVVLSAFNNRIYAFTWTNGAHGAEIWRSSSGDSGTWSRVVSSGFNSDANNQGASASETFGGYFYVGTFNTATGAEVWRSSTGNVASWTQVNADGFGEGSHNGGVTSFVVFHDALYASTTNCDAGGQVWRTTNGTTWEKLVTSGFGDAMNCTVDNLVIFGGSLYATTYNHPWETSQTGMEVWRTSDGVNWTQINPDGFGDSNNRGGYWGSSMAVFNGNLYFGTRNWANGGEVWQLLNQLYLPLIQR
jgi:hypothetical protein